jgi:hypothetical protein
MKRLILRNGMPTTAFDFVGTLQEKMKGHHFCSVDLKFQADGLWATPAEYIPGHMEGHRVEQLLHDIRVKLPGTPFQFVSVQWDGQRLNIKGTKISQAPAF